MQDLTTGSLTRHLLKTTSFMLVSMVFQTLYVLIDLFWVGRLGTDAVAAVGISGNLAFVVLAVSQMLGVGTTTLVSHAVGRKDQERALFVFNQSQVLSTATGVAFFVVAMLLRGAYGRALSADVGTMALADEYLQWFIPAMALQFTMIAMGSALRGTGNFKPGMVVQTGTVILNMVLAPFLIFGWGTGLALGVAGAALATFISVAVGALWIGTYFVGQRAYLRFRRADWAPRFPLWGDMVRIGLPAGAEFLLMAVNLAVVYVLARPFGAAAQAGFGVGFRIVQASFLPVVALGFAVAPVAGQNVGARQPDRVKATFRAGASLSAWSMAGVGLVVYLFAPSLTGLFSRDPAVIATSVEYLRIVVLNFVFTGITFVSASMFQAMGNTIPSLATSFIRLLVVTVPAVLLSRVPGFALRWIWYLTVGGVILQMTMNLLLLKREYRVRLSPAS
jgi:putative MATE family efflux protein